MASRERVMGRSGTSSPGRAVVPILAVGAFVTSLNTTLVSPLLALIAADFRVSDAVAGQLATITAASAGLTAVLVAPWLDRYPRATLLRCESFLLMAGSLLSIAAPSLTWLFVGRALAGVGGGFIFAVCMAAVGDIFPDADARNRAVGVVGTGATLGAVIGLPVITQLGHLGGWRMAMLPVLPLIVLLFVGTMFLPRTATVRESSLWRGWAPGYRRVLANRETVALLGVMVVLCAAWFGWLVYFGALATALGVGAGVLALLFLVGGGAEIAANALAPLFLRYASPGVVVLAATAVLSACLLATGFAARQPAALFPFVALASLASVVLFVTTSILLLDSLPQTRGAVMALQSAGFELGGAIGVAAVGAGLAVLGDYATVYRLLGIGLLVLLIPLLLASRRVNPRSMPRTDDETVTAPLPVAD